MIIPIKLGSIIPYIHIIYICISYMYIVSILYISYIYVICTYIYIYDIYKQPGALVFHCSSGLMMMIINHPSSRCTSPSRAPGYVAQSVPNSRGPWHGMFLYVYGDGQWDLP